MKKGTLVALTLFVMMAWGMGFITPPQAEAVQWGDSGALTVDVTGETPYFHIVQAIREGNEIGIYLSKSGALPDENTDIADLTLFAGEEVYDETVTPPKLERGQWKADFSTENLAPATEYFIGVYEKTEGQDADTYTYFNDAPSIKTVKITRYTDETQTATEDSATAPLSFRTGGTPPPLAEVTTAIKEVKKEGDVITATITGNVTNEDFVAAKILKEGVCIGGAADPTPDTGDCYEVDSADIAATFDVSIPSDTLELGNTYYIRAYAQNTANDGNPVYGASVSFSTAAPTVETTSANPGTISVTANGEVTAGEPNERGFVWSETESSPEIDGAGVTKVPESPLGTEAAFSVEIEELAENTAYYYRAYAINDFGTAYGETKTFTTFISGDFDDVNGLSLNDAIICLQVSIGMAGVTAPAGADASGNGKVDPADAALILMELAKPATP